MATQNLKRIIKAVNDNNIMAQVIPSPSNPKNSFKVVCNGIEFKSSQWTNEDIALFVEYAQGKIQADVLNASSVALQKVNTAHGTTAIKEADNLEKQLRTYADGIAHTIQLKGQSLTDVLNAYFNTDGLTEDCLTYYKNWINSMKHWHVDAKAKVLELLNKKQCFIFNEYVYTNYGIYYLVKNWACENDMQYSEDKIKMIVNKIIDKMICMGS